jgi:hypothetical protein
MESRWELFGWYNLLTEISKSGVFTKQGYSPFESAMVGNFWEMMIFMAREKYMNKPIQQ